MNCRRKSSPNAFMLCPQRRPQTQPTDTRSHGSALRGGNFSSPPPMTLQCVLGAGQCKRCCCCRSCAKSAISWGNSKQSRFVFAWNCKAINPAAGCKGQGCIKRASRRKFSIKSRQVHSHPSARPADSQGCPTVAAGRTHRRPGPPRAHRHSLPQMPSTTSRLAGTPQNPSSLQWVGALTTHRRSAGSAAQHGFRICQQQLPKPTCSPSAISFATRLPP